LKALDHVLVGWVKVGQAANNASTEGCPSGCGTLPCIVPKHLQSFSLSTGWIEEVVSQWLKRTAGHACFSRRYLYFWPCSPNASYPAALCIYLFFCKVLAAVSEDDVWHKLAHPCSSPLQNLFVNQSGFTTNAGSPQNLLWELRFYYHF